jgi:hypothetical protein
MQPRYAATRTGILGMVSCEPTGDDTIGQGQPAESHTATADFGEPGHALA